ncbi:MAG: hypothetical protein V3V15_04785 [Sphingorhabdus sp.]
MKFRKTNHMSAGDHKLVSEAVGEAEKTTDGEIVTIVADLSANYRETAYVWASLSALAVLALFALFPDFYISKIGWITSGWNTDFSIGQYAAIAGTVALLKWLAVWAIFHWQPLRLFLTLPFAKKRAVRLRAIDLFRVGTESRTVGRTGILIYLSLKEHRAEIVADEAIAGKVGGEVWGEAMLALVEHTRNRQPGQGMAEAVRQVGIVLSEHFPKSDGNPNELPDRLIEL